MILSAMCKKAYTLKCVHEHIYLHLYISRTYIATVEMDVKLLLGQSKVQLNDVIHRRSNAAEGKARDWLNLKGA